jgi:poly(3-hydroxybutyrate) depolymerase
LLHRTQKAKTSMLYQLHEMQRAFLTPMSEWAEASSKAYSDPYSPLSYLPFAKEAAAGLALMHRLGKDYDQPAWGLTETKVNNQHVSVVERIELEKPFCRLLKFDRLAPLTGSTKERLALTKQLSEDPIVLVFAPLSGHFATLLRDTVRALLPNHQVYVTEWKDARKVPLSAGPFHLDDYVNYCMEFIEHLGNDVNLISVCQPTVPVLAAVSLLASLKRTQPKTMTMMGGPIDARKSPTEVNNLATTRSHEWFKQCLIYTVPARYEGAGRRVYPGFLQHTGFVAMNPDRHMKSHYEFYKDLVRGDLDDATSHKSFYDEYNAVLDLPAEYYLDTVKTVFQDYALPEGKWMVKVDGKQQLVKPADIKKVRLLTIEGELDDISGSGQTQAALALCEGIPSKNKRHHTVIGAGHYGIFSGRRWRETVCPQIASFIRQAS